MKKPYKPFFENSLKTERVTILNQNQTEKFIEIVNSIRSKVDNDLDDSEYQKFHDRVLMYVRQAKEDSSTAEKVRKLFDVHQVYSLKPEMVKAVLKIIKYPQRVIDAMVQALDDVSSYILDSTKLTEKSIETISFPETEKEVTTLFNDLIKAGFEGPIEKNSSVHKFISSSKQVLLIQVGGPGSIGASGQPDEIKVYQSPNKYLLLNHEDFTYISTKPFSIQQLKSILKKAVINENAVDIIGPGLPISADEIKIAMMDEEGKSKIRGKYKFDLQVLIDNSLEYIKSKTGKSKKDLSKSDLDFIKYLADKIRKVHWVHPRNR